MRDSSSVLFKPKLYITFTKGAHQIAKLQTFDCSGEISPICTLIGSFGWKYIKFQPEKYRRVIYISWSWRVMQNLKKNRFFVSKMTRIWWILIRALKILKRLLFDWSLSCEMYNVWPKKKEKLTCGLENDMRNSANFHQNTLKCQNWYFHGILLSKVQNAWARSLRRSYL